MSPSPAPPGSPRPRRPEPAPEPPPPRLSARERARRRRRIGRLLFWLLAIGAIVAAIMLVRCGGGWGFGDGKGLGGGKGKGPGAGAATGTASGVMAPARCQLRVDATGVSLDGKLISIPAAVAACKTTTGADVLITDALQGTWDELRAALDAAGVPSLVRGATDPPPAPAVPPDAAGP